MCLTFVGADTRPIFGRAFRVLGIEDLFWLTILHGKSYDRKFVVGVRRCA